MWTTMERDERKMKPDVAIIGAGIIGSSIALQLATRGISVEVIDKLGGAGRGSTVSCNL